MSALKMAAMYDNSWVSFGAASYSDLVNTALIDMEL